MQLILGRCFNSSCEKCVFLSSLILIFSF